MTSIPYVSNKQVIQTETKQKCESLLNNVINQMDLADIRENFTPKLKNILASQQPIKLSSKLTRYYNTKQVSKAKKN